MLLGLQLDNHKRSMRITGMGEGILEFVQLGNRVQLWQPKVVVGLSEKDNVILRHWMAPYLISALCDSDGIFERRAHSEFHPRFYQAR